MTLYLARIQNFTLDRWDEMVDFVLNKPITSLIYSLAMKVFALYCSNMFLPLGNYLFYVLFSTSIVLDVAALSNFHLYKRNLLANINHIQQQIIRRVSEFFDLHVSAAGRAILRGFFFRE